MKGLKVPNPYPIKDLTLQIGLKPKQVVLPTMGAKIIVKVGDKVKMGEVIAEGNTYLHAPISGVVDKINDEFFPHPSRLKTKCIIIINDNLDKSIDCKKLENYQSLSPKELLKKLDKSGIVGLGGAGFATNLKLKTLKNCHTIIINATECEPSVEADNTLMVNYPKEILQGAEILQYITGAKKVIIAIEDDKKQAFKILSQQNNNKNIKIKQVKTIYTSGAEKILIRNLVGLKIPVGKFATEYGVLCQNVATTKAIYDYIINDMPLISRIITITGDNEKPRNVIVKNGTLISELIKNPQNIRLNGLMMGLDLPNTNYPVLKTTNAIFNNKKHKTNKIKDCIGCSECSRVCPEDLLPEQLYFFIKGDNLAKTKDYNIDSCILCRCCDEVCPSNIPLSDYFNYAIKKNKQVAAEEKQAEISKKRFEFREYRLARNKKERDEMMAKKREEAKKKLAAKQLENNKNVS